MATSILQLLSVFLSIKIARRWSSWILSCTMVPGIVLSGSSSLMQFLDTPFRCCASPYNLFQYDSSVSFLCRSQIDSVREMFVRCALERDIKGHPHLGRLPVYSFNKSPASTSIQRQKLQLVTPLLSLKISYLFILRYLWQSWGPRVRSYSFGHHSVP